MNDSTTGVARKSPTQRLPSADVGAQTLGNYKYQSVYGVVLLCGAVAGKHDYQAIWCEQEDDILAEITPSLFDAYQIKTKTPELGYWDITFKGFVGAIRNFLRIEREFPNSIRYYNFICDAQPLDSQGEAKLHRCPLRLTEGVRTGARFEELSAPAQKGIALLARRVKCSCGELLPILQRLRFPPEPLRKEPAIEVLIATHLPLVPCCESASSTKLRRVAVNAIALVDEASRLASHEADRHYACLDPRGEQNPQLLAKRVSREDFLARCGEVLQSGFRYVPELRNTAATRANPNAQRFYKKLERGSLEEQADTLRARSIAAEAALLDLATRPDGVCDVNHLRTLVKAECDDALAIASQHAEPFGREMYRHVLQRLDTLAREQAPFVLRQRKEILLGIAGLLTEECQVWWSNRFDLDAETAHGR